MTTSLSLALPTVIGLALSANRRTSPPYTKSANPTSVSAWRPRGSVLPIGMGPASLSRTRSRRCEPTSSESPISKRPRLIGFTTSRHRSSPRARSMTSASSGTPTSWTTTSWPAPRPTRSGCFPTTNSRSGFPPQLNTMMSFILGPPGEAPSSYVGASGCASENEYISVLSATPQDHG